MLNVPNEEKIRNLVQKIDDEYDLEMRLASYKKKAPELLEFASKEGLEGDDAARALFVSDFIVTASEIPQGGTDEDRYRSVFKSFIQGKQRCESTEAMMRIFYLAYKTASQIRSQDLFMGGRGLSRKPALIRLKDSYLAPYLLIASEVLGTGNQGCGWELGILSAALTRKFPDTELQMFDGAPEFSNQRRLTPYSWRLFEDYMQTQKVDMNQNIVIPNLKDTNSILLFNEQKTSFLSLYNYNTISNFTSLEKELKNSVKSINQRLDGDDLELVLIKADVFNTGYKLFLVRDPLINTKPLLILRTPADEINLTKVLTILRMRGQEHDGWKSIFTRGGEKQIKERKKEEIKVTDTAIEEPQELEPKKKRGFFSKIKQAIFGTKKPSKIDKPVKEISPQRKKILKLKKIPSSIEENSFIAEGITVDSVSDLDIFERFDTIREENYKIIGIFESEFQSNVTNYSIYQNKVQHSEFVNFLNTISSTIFTLLPIAFSEEHRVIIEELFFINKSNEKQIITLDGNQERIVGTIAISASIGEIDEWQLRGKDEKESLQRRSLHMRTKQLLTARRHTPFIEATERIFSDNFHFDEATTGTSTIIVKF